MGKLLVGTRDCTKIVDRERKHVGVVRSVMGDEVPVHVWALLCGADWPLIGGSFTTRGVEVLWPKRLFSRWESAGPLGLDTVARVHRRLVETLSSA